MFKFFSNIGKFFKSLFGQSGLMVQTILTDVSVFVNKAQPIVTSLAVLSQLNSDQSGLVKAINRWASAGAAELNALQEWTTKAQNMERSDVLRSAAILLLERFVPPGTPKSSMNLAIELAYSIHKQTSK